MALFALGLIHLTTIYWVAAQDGKLTQVHCENSPCESERSFMSFEFSGSVPPAASSDIDFYKSGVTIPFCSVPWNVPCSPVTTTPCNCTEAGGIRTYHLYISSANTSVHNGDWTAVLLAGNPTETVRSSVCQIQVNTSCPYLTTDACPETVNEDEPFYISFAQGKRLPNTAGSLLTIMNEENQTIEATINLTVGVQQVQPAGCYERDGKMIYYLNLTGASEVHTGRWIAFVTNATGTIRSDGCRVAVGDREAHHSGRTLVILLAVFCAFVVVMFILSFVLERVVLLFRITCIISTLFCVIPTAEINLQVLDIIYKYYTQLHQATIAFVVIGSVIMLVAVVVTIIFLVKRPPIPRQENGNAPPSRPV